ncbi:hypothetical protein [Thermodesulfovibrio hydrogeniphilus]
MAVVLNRIIEPRSKYASVGWIRRSGFMELFDLREEDMHVNEIYRAMDKLYEKMDNVLDDFYKTGAQGTKLLLYDITSVYFEGQGPLGLARYGYSRDGKPDKKQVLLCLCLNENKFPVHFDVIETVVKNFVSHAQISSETFVEVHTIPHEIQPSVCSICLFLFYLLSHI